MGDAVCKLCGDPITDYVGMWCFGCRAYVCDDHPQTIWGEHNPEDHDKTGGDDE
jgi:hypothetical protein